MKRILLLFIIALAFNHAAIAQVIGSTIPQMFTPNATELGKYGRTPVNYFNGLPIITVPLTEVNAKGYTLPVYLTYHASGNKPDQHPGWVGQGWTLHAGGSISRVINGQRDETSAAEYIYKYNITPSTNPGYFYHMAETQTNSDWSNPSTLISIASVYDFDDHEPDEFMINIEGIQASFYFVGENDIRIVSRTDASFDVEYELATETAGPGLVVYPFPANENGDKKAYRFTYIRSLIVRDREGNRYYFGGDDSAIEYSIQTKPSFRIEYGSLYNNNSWNALAIPTSWMLTRIERPDGEVISFSYEKDGTPLVECDVHHGEAYTITNGYPGEGESVDTKDNPSFKDNLSFFFLQPSYLTKISCRVSGDSLVFAHTPTTELDYGINENDFNLRVGVFSDYYGMSITFSHWMARSYYNQLSAIDGAGRHIAFSYTASTTERLKLLEVQFKTAGGNAGSVDHKYAFTYNTTSLPGYNAKQSDIWGFYNGIYYGNTYGIFGSGMEAIRVADPEKMKAEILTEITYPTGGKTVFEYEPHTYSKVTSIYPSGISSIGEDKIAGGLRIKSITDYPGGGKQEKRTFSYQNPSTSLSSGILSGSPRTRCSGHISFDIGSYDYDIDYVIYSENPVLPLSETDGNHVTYSYVKETFLDGGYTVYSYSNHDSVGCLDEDPTLTLGFSQGNTPYSRFQSRSLLRGLLLERTDYNSNGTPARKETNTYHSSESDYLKSVAEEKYCVDSFILLSYVKKYCHYPYLSSKTITNYQDSGTAITETYSYQYNTDRRKTKETHSRVGNQEDGTAIFYPADRSGEIYSDMLNAGMSGVPVGQASLLGGNVVAAQELKYKLSVVETASGLKYLPVPEALYSAELSTPVSLSTYSASPSAYLADPDIEYLRYDGHANLTGARTRDGICSTYMWDQSSLHPVLIARDVYPGETIIQDQDRQKYYSLTHPVTSTFSDSFTTSEASTITFSFQTVYGYDWLYHVSVDSQSGYFVVVAAFETPPAEWIQYSSQYSASIQFSLPAGTHQYTLTPVQVRKATGNASSSAGSILCSYMERGQTVTAGDPLLLVDFEDETTTLAGCHGQHCHAGAYTLNQSVGTDRNYVLDYMLYENGAWSYHRQSYSGGSLTLGAAGKYLDDIRVFPADCDLATAGYDAAGLPTTRTDARGVTEHYDYDGLRRLVRVSDNAGNPVEDYAYNYAKSGAIHNSVTTKTYTAANNTGSYRTAVSYLDSLGRPSQQVLADGAASGWDLVTYQDYDACGREFRKWLPAPVQVVSGGHAAGAYASLAEIQAGGNQVYSSSDSYRYEQPVYEASPRDRIIEAFGPGSAWRSGSGHRTRSCLRSNVASTSSPYYYRGFSLSWTGNSTLILTRKSASGAGAMQIMQTTDEDEQITLEFLDARGKTVLIRKVYDSTTFLDTYYVYDDFGRLTAVLSPELLTHLTNGTIWNYNTIAGYAYLYRYDSRGNCIARSLPGAGWTYTVYDKGNRPVLTQDAAQRAQNANAWTFAIPDRLGRPALRGTATLSVDAFADPYKTAVVQASLPKTPTYSGTYRGYVLSGITLSSPVLLEVDYYDAYGFAGTSPFPAANNADFAYDSSIGTSFSAYYAPSAQGMQTGSLLKVLDNTAGNQYLWSVSYFDDKCRVVQHRASTHLGGVEKDWFLYDFTGNATKRKTEHKPSSGTSLIETVTQTYNTWGHPVKTTHKLGSGTAQVVSNRTYDKAGRLATDKRNGTAALKTTFSYNIRSWVTGITGTLFTETLKYQDGTPARWGGDVSQATWKDDRATQTKSYTFGYDTVGRLTAAAFSDAAGASINFSENVSAYDANGNITGLQRYGRTSASAYGLIDNLAYTYSGNKATSIKDTGSAAYSSDFRFSNGTNNTYSFSYDAAGRMTSDASKGISSITWNVLGLPQTVTFSSGAVINYSYAADGTKLREARTASSTTTTTDYTGNLVLENGTRSRLLFDGGYMSLSDNAYHYFLTDHLGSVRVVANASGTAEEYNHYYPLGGPIAKYSTATSIQPVKYQGKEWGASKGLNLYDFGARRYDPATGRWLSQDPMAEKYYSHSPYLFCGANPMRFVDPEGMIWYSIDSEGHITVVDSKKDGLDRLYSNYQAGRDENDYIQVLDNSILQNLVYAPKQKDKNVYKSQSDNANDIFSVFKYVADHSDKEWVVHRNGDTYTIGTKLDTDSASSYQDFGISKPDASIHSHPDTPISEEAYSMGYGANQYYTDLRKVESGQSPRYNYVYFPESHNVFLVNPSYPVFIRKVTSVKSFYWGTLNTK